MTKDHNLSDDAALLPAMTTNLATHMAWVPARWSNARVIDSSDLLVVDSSFPTDTLNTVCRSALSPHRLQERIAEVLAFFAQGGRAFSWWISPTDTPSALPTVLQQMGLTLAETEMGMAATLDDPLPPAAPPMSLQIRRAVKPQQIADFGAVVGASSEPPDMVVAHYYAATASLFLEPDCPQVLVVGYLGNRPVATVELCLAGGVAGVYSLTTLAHVRRQGIGAAMMLHALREAREAGLRTAVLQAAPGAEGLHARLGFQAVGHYAEYKLPAR